MGKIGEIDCRRRSCGSAPRGRVPPAFDLALSERRGPRQTGCGGIAVRAEVSGRAASGIAGFSGFVVMLHGYDHVSLFVPGFDVPVSLGSLFQRVASINDRLYLPRLNELSEVN